MEKYKTTNKDYFLEDYSLKWVERFDVIKKQIESLLGNEVIQIEHVGSTSIGIKSKPVIDVLVILSDITDFDLEIEKLEIAGYECKENYISENSFFLCKEVNRERVENIHILPLGHAHINQLLDKRNYLRENPGEAKRYEEVKTELAKKFPNDYVAYRKGKDNYLNNELVEKIKSWKKLA